MAVPVCDVRMQRSTALVFVVGALSLGLGACKGKVEQCNAFIDRANQSQSVINGLQLDTDDPKKLDTDATKIETEAKAVTAVQLKDEKLVKFRDDYGSNLTKLGKNVRDLSKLQADAKTGKTTVAAEAKRIEEDANKIEKDETKLVNDINQYCTGSP